MPKPLPRRLIEILKDVGLTEKQAVWDCHGTPVVLHKALEKVAAHYNIVFDQPNFVEHSIEKKHAVVCVTGHMGDATEWSIGEAAPYNNKNNYPFAMAEKRAKDRVILKLVGLHGDVYSQEEADDFKEEIARQQQSNKSPETALVIPMDERIEAAITFYENCNAENFEKGEKKYQKLLNAVGISEDDYNRLVEAHDKRKLELEV